MLLEAKRMKDLSFAQLMEVYIEGNLDKECGLLQAEQDFFQYLREGFFATDGAVYYVWQQDGKYVSALRLEPFRDGWLLEALETAPDCRRNGYAEALMRSVIALPAYGRIYSHVHKKNIPSQRLHEKCGFRKILDQAVYIDGSVNSYACTWCYGR